MTEGKQSNNTMEKVSYILGAQDFYSKTAATYDTSFNVEQHKKEKILTWGGDFGVLHDSLLCSAMLSSSSLPSSSLQKQSQNYQFSRPFHLMTTASHGR